MYGMTASFKVAYPSEVDKYFIKLTKAINDSFVINRFTTNKIIVLINTWIQVEDILSVEKFAPHAKSNGPKRVRKNIWINLSISSTNKQQNCIISGKATIISKIARIKLNEINEKSTELASVAKLLSDNPCPVVASLDLIAESTSPILIFRIVLDIGKNTILNSALTQMW